MIFHDCIELSAWEGEMQNINEYDVKIGIRLPNAKLTITALLFWSPAWPL